MDAGDDAKDVPNNGILPGMPPTTPAPKVKDVKEVGQQIRIEDIGAAVGGRAGHRGRVRAGDEVVVKNNVGAFTVLDDYLSDVGSYTLDDYIDADMVSYGQYFSYDGVNSSYTDRIIGAVATECGVKRQEVPWVAHAIGIQKIFTRWGIALENLSLRSNRAALEHDDVFVFYIDKHPLDLEQFWVSHKSEDHRRCRRRSLTLPTEYYKKAALVAASIGDSSLQDVNSVAVLDGLMTSPVVQSAVGNFLVATYQPVVDSFNEQLGRMLNALDISTTVPYTPPTK
jgi:hypothetical protein